MIDLFWQIWLLCVGHSGHHVIVWPHRCRKQHKLFPSYTKNKDQNINELCSSQIWKTVHNFSNTGVDGLRISGTGVVGLGICNRVSSALAASIWLSTLLGICTWIFSAWAPQHQTPQHGCHSESHAPGSFRHRSLQHERLQSESHAPPPETNH